MHHQNFSLFQQIQNREISGKKLIIQPSSISKNEKKAKQLIAMLKKEHDLNAKIKYFEELKNLAILDVKSAIKFYKGQHLACYHSLELSKTLSLAFKEIGYYTQNPYFLYEAFYCLSCYHGYNPSQDYISILEGFDCLRAAAKMRSKYAISASFILAYLYSAELGYHFNNSRPLGLASLSHHYYQFSIPMDKLTNEDKKMLYQSKSIHCNQIRLEGEIAFASLGCKEAIQNLINWYKTGNEDLQIKMDLSKANEWQQRLINLPDFLTKKYAEYYEIVLQNTCQFGYINFGTPALDFIYFVEVWGEIKFGPDYPLKTVFATVKEYFIKEAESGNMTTCLVLGNAELKNNNLEDAKKWFNQILKINADTCSKPAQEAIKAARKCYDISIKENKSPAEQYPLLKTAALLGCVDSLIEIGIIHLQECLDDAKEFFNLALIHSSSTSIPYKISKELYKVLDKYSLELIEPYCLVIEGEAIKRGSISSINNLIDSIQTILNDKELASSWKRIYRSRRNKQEIDTDVIDKLINITLERFATFNGYYRESKARSVIQC